MKNGGYRGKRELVGILKSSLRSAPEGAAERCIAAVNAANNASHAAECERKHQVQNKRRQQNKQQQDKQEQRQNKKADSHAFLLFELIALQFRTIQRVTYVLTAALTAMQFMPFIRLSSADGFACSGILNSIVLLIFAWHLMIIPAEDMKELEKSCKYSYGQLLSARVVCMGAVGMLLMLAAAVSAVQAATLGEFRIEFALSALLPTVCAAFNALLWTNYISSSDFAMVSVYAVSAVAIALLSEVISEAGTIVLCGAIGILILGIVFQTMKIMNRRVYDEAYDY